GPQRHRGRHSRNRRFPLRRQRGRKEGPLSDSGPGGPTRHLMATRLLEGWEQAFEHLHAPPVHEAQVNESLGFFASERDVEDGIGLGSKQEIGRASCRERAWW